MKKIIFFIIFLSYTGTSAFAQCDASSKIAKCAPSPDSGYTLIKSFEVDGEGGSKTKIEYSYVFTKGTKYLINVCGA